MVGSKLSFEKRILCSAIFFIIAFLFFHLIFFSAPSGFPTGKYIEINSGLTVSEVADYLHQENLIRFPFFFRIFVTVFGTTDKVIAGEYEFQTPLPLYNLVRIVTDTKYKGRAIRVTFPEGYTSMEMSRLLLEEFPGFDSSVFLSNVKANEGYLYPDTYIFPTSYSVDQIINRMRDNFKAKILPLRDEIIATKYTTKQIVIMASILEREARTLETRKNIAGILWKRLDAGKPLQVDAPFGYLLNKGTSELTAADLTLDSPYNTYRYKGLPPTPISNPGISAIQAAIEPISTPYWFYLSDKSGVMHYAKTYEEHLNNKVLYLK